MHGTVCSIQWAVQMNKRTALTPFFPNTSLLSHSIIHSRAENMVPHEPMKCASAYSCMGRPIMFLCPTPLIQKILYGTLCCGEKWLIEPFLRVFSIFLIIFFQTVVRTSSCCDRLQHKFIPPISSLGRNLIICYVKKCLPLFETTLLNKVY